MYVPRILLCGDREDFLQKIGDMKVDIIGQVSFKGAFERGEATLFSQTDSLQKEQTRVVKDFHVFLDGFEISIDDLKKIMDEVANYIVFNSTNEFSVRIDELFLLNFAEKVITTQTLLKYARDNFYSIKIVATSASILLALKVSRVLDVDNYFAKNDLFYMWINPPVEIETIDKNSFAQKYPVVENVYSKIFHSLDECRLRSYDLLFITADREPAEFFKLLKATDSMAKKILTFVGKKSEMSFCLKRYESAFEKVSRMQITNGEWVLLQKRVPPEDFACYVVTHKDIKLDAAALPDGYKIIHAGHATAKEDFGYLGDDTGDNISKLNRYLNEVTALYWMWKNTRHSIIGLCHYRRFFTARFDWTLDFVYEIQHEFDSEKILTAQEARNILSVCDVIVVKGQIFAAAQTELKAIIFNFDLNQHAENVFRKYLALRQPDYLEAFDYVSSSFSEYMYEMFITRRHVFEAYCEWLFSFILDVTEEILSTTGIAESDNDRKYRSIGLISERLMSVWLMKNHLRIRTLPIMFRKNV